MRRETIVNNLLARLSSINHVNGYEWEPKVFEWLASPLGQEELPAIIVKDTEDNIDSQKVSWSSEHHLKVEILLFVKEGEQTPKALRKKMQDILQVLGKVPEDGVDLGDYISFDGNEMLIEQQHEIEGGAKIEITITYNTEKWSI